MPGKRNPNPNPSQNRLAHFAIYADSQIVCKYYTVNYKTTKATQI